MSYKSRIPQIIGRIDPRVKAVLRAGADAIAKDAQERVPVDSGNLQESIHVDEDGNDFYVVAGDEDTFYGHFVELGTTRVPAQPFLVPAFEANREAIKDDVKAALAALEDTL